MMMLIKQHEVRMKQDKSFDGKGQSSYSSRNYCKVEVRSLVLTVDVAIEQKQTLLIAPGMCGRGGEAS